MKNLKNIIAILVFAMTYMAFQSCKDEPEITESPIYEDTIGRGEAISAQLGTLRFTIVNNYPNLVPSEGLSNYLDSPSITYIGEIESLNDLEIPEHATWHKSCEIIDNGGYIVRVKGYDASDRADKMAYLFLYIKEVGDHHLDSKPGVFHDDIHVTYKMKTVK